MKKIISICLLTFTLFSCNSDEIINGFDFDTSLNISITGSNGHDLLDPINSDAFDQSKIKILYLVGGKLIQKPNGTDYPGNFLIYKQDNRTIMRIFLNDSEDEKYPETYIQWDENHTDIIKIEFNRTKNAVSKKTIWFNNELKTDIVPYLKIVK
ncbi:hypothetical protein [Flavobacterium sp. N2038]|uniref:hypothetical protein n=1 Tax=Flavobacterium sp. N2038 TaxID=2986829 RepID=UPI00222566AD|nr:hypothetical protein [Flavobacterium sp. N2038]